MTERDPLFEFTTDEVRRVRVLVWLELASYQPQTCAIESGGMTPWECAKVARLLLMDRPGPDLEWAKEQDAKLKAAFFIDNACRAARREGGEPV